MPICWYVYNGGDVNSPLSYTLGSCVVGPSCCNGDRICAIAAPNGGNNPSVISANIQSYIQRSLSTLACQPDYPSGATIWVRMKPTPPQLSESGPPSSKG